MNQRILLLRTISAKTSNNTPIKDLSAPKIGWIASIRQALGMTALQLAKRLGVTQPRIAKMELNEKNLKISTMQKMAEALNCDFVYGFIPKKPLQVMINERSREKAAEILSKVNVNMALEDQLAKDPHIIDDLAEELVAKNIKQIWDE